MTLTIEGYEPKESESFFIEYWYDIHQKYWVIQIFDNNNIEQECIVGIRKQGLNEEISYYKNKYLTDEVRKV